MMDRRNDDHAIMAALYGFASAMPRPCPSPGGLDNWSVTACSIWACIAFADKGLWAVFSKPGKLGQWPPRHRPDYDRAPGI